MKKKRQENDNVIFVEILNRIALGDAMIVIAVIKSEKLSENAQKNTRTIIMFGKEVKIIKSKDYENGPEKTAIYIGEKAVYHFELIGNGRRNKEIFWPGEAYSRYVACYGKSGFINKFFSLPKEVREKRLSIREFRRLIVKTFPGKKTKNIWEILKDYETFYRAYFAIGGNCKLGTYCEQS